MSDQKNDFELNTNDVQKVTDYAKAFDSLRTSINGISNPLNKLSNNINSLDRDLSKFTDSINKLNSQNQSLADSSNKIQTEISDLSSSFSSWKGILTTLNTALKGSGETLGGWGVALSAVLAVLSVHSDGIIKWVKELINGTTTLSALNKVIKDNKIVLDALNQSKAEGDRNAQQELVHLKLLYNATQDHNLALKERKKAINEIRDQYPNNFKNISDETILTGKATKQYNDLAAAIIASARARAAEDIMVKNQIRQLGNDDIIKKLTPQLEKVKKELKAATDENDSIKKKSAQIPGYNGAYGGGLDSRDPAGDIIVSRLTKRRNAIQKLLSDHITDSNLLDRQNQLLAKSVAENTEKYGTQIITGLHRISEATNNFRANKKAKQDQTRGADLLEAQSITFAKQIELDKQHYDTELVLLNDQLGKKLISQDDYNKQAEQLQEKFHLAIGDKVQFFTKNDFDEAKKNMQDMFTAAEQQRLTIDNDQKNVDKAILPGQKLDAEKQLITDKYNYEISQAAGNANKIKELETKKQQEITQLTQQYEQQRQDFAMQSAQQVANAAFSILQNNIKNQSDAKIKGLEKDKAAELSNKSLTGTQRQAIEAKYQKQEAAEKVKAFKSEQKASILQAVINGALAVTKATSQAGMLAAFVIPGIIASTAIQVATIAAQKPPQYAQGGLHYQSDGRGALLPGYSRTDNTNAYLRSGEAIVVSEAMRNPWARNLVSAINVAHGGRDFSIPNPSRGYAIGGIFTDGGNANRYYNQPVNDVKELANTLAYQMINNFPPVYVDVKDINNQQNILAQTVNRVNL
ncbi:hypothetical protein SAMN05421821_103202 [Mucilaginibacter lappiensis]|uniref:Uncharacterized protein n=1 Tax=Mucilaginibacter lappiensis TaxID=354630 RepID=A0ABR6PGT1_9SPHI|nr:hypothetical protein [Mucilaginibacter lappiensis]MBB6108968.1 hypothetical protein [Mucilaginibacter lappiensis]SIQ69828.1 hypothetical protein SAMN05421821_103202 [Mucilaginibacter lappiensis]